MLVTEQQRAAAAELLRRDAARDSLTDFREYMAASQSVDFQHPPAQHHQLIMHKLEALERGDIQRLMILAPPGSAKSTYCSIQFPLWRLARRPEQNILTASNTQELADNFNRRRRNLALTAEWQALAETKLADDLQGVTHFGTQRQGGIRAAGVGSSIVGFRSHLNVLDDPIRGLDEALSAPTLEKQWDWFNHEFRTRLVPNGRELIVSTRWAKQDIAGRLLATESQRWDILRLPMVADRDDDPLGRELGESLWPEYFGPEFIAEKQKNVLLWSTQFQQTPLDESGSWVGQGHLHFVDSLPDNLSYVLAVDLALTLGRGDYTVIVVAGLDADRNLYIVKVDRSRCTPEKTVAKIAELNELYSPTAVLADDDNMIKVMRPLMHEIYRSQGKSPPPLEAIPMRGKDKETRAAAIRGLFLADRVRILKRTWAATLAAELLDFPSGEHDDQVDALGLIGRRYPVLVAGGGIRPQRLLAGRSQPRVILRPDGVFELTTNLDEMFNDREARMSRARNRV